MRLSIESYLADAFDSMASECDRREAETRSLLQSLVQETKRAWETVEDLVYENNELRQTLDKVTDYYSKEHSQKGSKSESKIDLQEHIALRQENSALEQRISALEAQLEKERMERESLIQNHQQTLSIVDADLLVSRKV